MDGIQQEQDAMREEIDTVKIKIDKIFEIIQALARREEKICVVTTVRNVTLFQGFTLQSEPSVLVPNPVI